MSRRSDKKAAQAAAQQGQVSAPSSYGGGQAFELQVFDGKGHAGVMVFSTGSNRRIVQRLRRGRDWGAHLPHVH